MLKWIATRRRATNVQRCEVDVARRGACLLHHQNSMERFITFKHSSEIQDQSSAHQRDLLRPYRSVSFFRR